MNPPCISAQSHADDEAERRALALDAEVERILDDIEVVVTCMSRYNRRRCIRAYGYSWALWYQGTESEAEANSGARQHESADGCMSAGQDRAEEWARELAKANLATPVPDGDPVWCPRD